MRYGMWIEIDDGFVGKVHTALVLSEKLGCEAAEGVEFHTRNELAVGILFLHSSNGGAELGWRMSEVFVKCTGIVFGYKFKTLAGTREGADDLIELSVGDSQGIAGVACGSEVEQVVVSEDFERGLRGGEISDTILHPIGGYAIGDFGYVGTLVILRHLTHYRVFGTVDKGTLRLDKVDELGELVFVDVKGRKDIHMVPLDTSNDCHIGFVEVELGTAVDRRSEVFVTLNDHDLGGLAETDHYFKAFELSANHVVRLDAAMLQDVEDHCRSGSLAMAATDNDARLLLRLFVEVFRVAVDFETQLLRTEEFGVVVAGMHTKDNFVDVFGDSVGVPPYLLGQQAVLLESALGGIKNLIVGTCYMIAFEMKGYGEVVHGTSSYGNKMDVHY